MIELFSKPRCVQCDATKRALDKMGIEYVVYDVTKDLDALRRLQTETDYTQAPVVIVDGKESWSGFRIDRIKALAPAD